ncbi:sensor histidine kinase [Anaerotignum sp.]|uniref:sensor histidine kinase n=1 Tax=Anaerotignum sp. TaxID=2039241 RepID=UPI0028AA93FB|nr:ATP-binding protein [Anaerotignum sp.]
MSLLTPLRYMILSAAVTTLIFGVIYLFSSRGEQASSMRTWGICWILYSFSFIVDITHMGTPEISYVFILLKQLVSLAAAFLFLQGAYRFFHLEFPSIFMILSLFSLITILAGFALNEVYELFLIPNVLLNTFLLSWAGCIFYLYTWTQNIPEKFLLCFLIILWGVYSNNFAFLLPELTLSILNYLGSLLILNVTIVYLLIIYYKKIYYLLNKQQLRFRMLVENATEHIFLYDYKKYCFEYISPSAEKIFGFTASELKRDTSKFLKYIKSVDQERLWPILESPPSQSSMDTFQVIRDDTEPIWCEIHYSPITDDNGVVTSLEWILRDITPRKKIEAELKDAENIKRELLEDISHEIKTPVTLIMGYTEAILNKSIPEASVNSYIRNIYSKTELLNTLLNDFMQASVLTSQSMEFRFYEVNAKEFIENILTQCENQIVNSEMFFCCENKIPDNIFLVIDVSRIEQVFSNLITNAKRYAGKGSTITISATMLETITPIEARDSAEMVPLGEILIKVMDNGKGFDKQDIPLLFHRKYQGSNHNAKGSGLGLYISKQIITQHSGRIWANNEPPNGAAFYFTLPFYQEDYDSLI